MRRQKDWESVKVNRIFTLFHWTFCSCCKNEFRRERGWKFFGYPIINGWWNVRFICGTCGPTRSRAGEIAWKINNRIPSRPPHPRNPPKPPQEE